jgi:hypothetical protein
MANTRPKVFEKFFENQDTWQLAGYIDRTHFKMIRAIGIGSHSTIWEAQLRYPHILANKFKKSKYTEDHKEEKEEENEEKEGNQDQMNNQLGIKKHVAMKVMSKARLHHYRSIESVKYEVRILS